MCDKCGCDCGCQCFAYKQETTKNIDWTKPIQLVRIKDREIEPCSLKATFNIKHVLTSTGHTLEVFDDGTSAQNPYWRVENAPQEKWLNLYYSKQSGAFHFSHNVMGYQTEEAAKADINKVSLNSEYLKTIRVE